MRTPNTPAVRIDEAADGPGRARRRPITLTVLVLLAYVLVVPWLHPGSLGDVVRDAAPVTALAGNATAAAAGTTRSSQTVTQTATTGTSNGGPTSPAEPGATVGVGRPSCLANNANPNQPPCESPFTLGPTSHVHLPAVDIAPGDRVERALDLTSHTAALRTFTLTSRDSRSSALTSDAARGLQLHIDRCPQPWAATVLVNGGRTYTCPAGAAAVRTVLAATEAPRRGSIVTSAPLTNLTVVGRVTTDHLRLTLRLPDDAPLGLAGHSTSLSYTFTGTS